MVIKCLKIAGFDCKWIYTSSRGRDHKIGIENRRFKMAGLRMEQKGGHRNSPIILMKPLWPSH